MQRQSVLQAQIDRAIAGDEQAFADLVHTCENTLYSATMAILRNEQDAMDATQDAILTAWRKLHTLREHAYFNTWITRIAIRTAINHKRRRKPTTALYEVPSVSSDRDEILDVRLAMNGLDEQTRLCAVLYYYEDFTIDQVAQAVGIRGGTVKSRLHKARQQLRKALEVHDGAYE